MLKYNVQMQAWTPLAFGNVEILENEEIKKIGLKYGKTNAQVALRFLVQRGLSTVPKSTKREWMKENLDLFDSSLLSKRCHFCPPSTSKNPQLEFF